MNNALKTALAVELEKWIDGPQSTAFDLAEQVLLDPSLYLDSIEDMDKRAAGAKALQDALTKIKRGNRATARAVIRVVARAALGALA